MSACLYSPKEIRALSALFNGEKNRESLDRLIGASNAPDVVFRLRAKGFDVGSERRGAIDRDGQTCRPGWYWLTEAGLEMARKVLAGGCDDLH